MKNHYNVGILGTPIPVAWIGTGTDCILLDGTGTAWIGTSTVWLLLGGVPVQPCFGTDTTSGILPINVSFATFGTNFLHTTSPFLNTSKTNMELI